MYAVLDVLSQCIFGVILLRKAPPVLSDWGEESMQQVCVSSSSCACSFAHPCLPSPTLSPTDPVPRGLLTLWARAGPVYAYMYVCMCTRARARARHGRCAHICTRLKS